MTTMRAVDDSSLGHTTPRWPRFRRLARSTVGLLTLALALLFATSAAASGAPVWPLIGFDAAHTYRSPASGPGEPVGARWVYTNEATHHSGVSPVIGGDGTIYVGYYFALEALKPNGVVKWRYYVEAGTCQGAAVAGDGTVYVVTTEGELDAVRSDGTRKWVFHGKGLFTPPTIGGDGTIYVASDAWGVDGVWQNGYLYAVNPDGSQKWVFHAGRMQGTGGGSPVALGPDGTVYAANLDGNLYALDPSTGTQKWAFDASGTYSGDITLTCPSVGPDGTVYVGNLNGDLYAVGPSGAQKWVYSIRGPKPSPAIQWWLTSAALAADGTVYMGVSTRDLGYNDTVTGYHPGTGAITGKLCAIRPDGTLKWSVPTAGHMAGPPAIDANGMLYLPIGYAGSYAGAGYTGSGALSVIGPDGATRWSYTTGLDATFNAVEHTGFPFTPAIAADGTVIVSCWDNKLYALGTPMPAPTMSGFSPRSGPVGTVVTLTGSGFTDASAVSFGGADASTLSVDDDTQMTAVVPEAAVSGDIVVTAPGGDATSPSAFTVTGEARISLKLGGLKHGVLKHGRRLTCNGKAQPDSLAGGVVTITVQRKKGAGWTPVRSAHRAISPECTYAWSYKPLKRGLYRARAAVAKTSSHAAAKTGWRSFRAR